MYEVFALRYGSRSTHRSDVFLNYSVYGEPDSPIDMDYYLWVIRGHGRTFVVDTGFSLEGGRSRARQRLHEPVDLLGRVNVDPASVDAVIVTHAHYDHIGCLPEFPHCEVIISRREFDFWTSAMAGRAQFAHSAEQVEISHLRHLRNTNRLTQVGPDYLVAPGIRTIEVGGHTPGQLIVDVSNGPSRIILASDALHYYEELDRDRPFAAVADLPDMYRAFDLIGNLAKDPSTTIVAGHDPAVMTRYRTVRGESDIVRIS